MGAGRRTLLLALLLAVAASACDEGSASNTAADVLQAQRPASAADRLGLLIGVRLEAPSAQELEPFDGSFLDAAQLRTVTLRVDGEPWGTFEPAPPTASDPAGATTTVQGWRVGGERNLALVIAVMGEGADDAWPLPTTAGEWVEHMQRRLLPGGHVAEVSEVVLANEDGEEMVLRPGLYLPFTLEEGAASGVVGPATVSLSDLGGGQ